MTTQLPEVLAPADFVLVDRKGSGRVVHRGRPHGVSSTRLLCGRLLLRVDTAGILDHSPSLTRGLRLCPTCAELAP